MPALFELSACDVIPAETLDAAGFEPEPENTLGEAGSDTGNGCWWGGSSRLAQVGFVLSDLEMDSYPACGTRVEVEPGVILEVIVSISQTPDYSTEDEPRYALACETLDQFLPEVTAQIPS